MRTRDLWQFGLCALLLLPAGCRDGVPPFVPPDREVLPGPVRQLTFGTGSDRDPRWSRDGTELLYHTDLFGTLPSARGVLLALRPATGVATPLFPDAQRRGSYLLAAPVPSPAGDRIAYIDLLGLDAPAQCAIPFETPPPLTPDICRMQPLLDSAVLRVRRPEDTGLHALDPGVAVRFPGPDPAYRFGQPGPYVQRIFPFQAMHRQELALLFRPSWAPDGQRLVTGDGLRLLIWRVGAAVLDTVPGTVDGVTPAWSPDGEWIAFTRLVRGDSASYSCSCANDQQHRRTLYSIAARRVVLVRPDGSGVRELGDGEDPTWSPDGQHVYVVRNSAVVRIAVQGGGAVTVPNTLGARSPSVSPDGRWLAFSRAKPQNPLDHDIWLVSLAP